MIRPRQVMWTRAAAVAATLAWSSGCGLVLRSNIHDPDPASKIPALVEAADHPTHEERAAMVKALEHDDVAVRLFAIESLTRVTGDSRGYRPYDRPDRRADAVARWRTWLHEPQPREPAQPQEQPHGER